MQSQTIPGQCQSPESHKLRERFKQWWPLIRPAWPFMVGGLLAGVGFAALSGAGLPAMLKTVMPIFFGQEQEASPWVVQTARYLFGEHYQDPLLLLACLGMPVVFLLRGWCSFLNRYWVNQAGFIFLEGLRRQTFERLQTLPLAFYYRHKTGDLTSRLVNDAEQIRSLILLLSNDAIKQPLVLLAALGYLIWVSMVERSAFFTLVAMITIPLCVLPLRMVTRRLLRRARLVARQSGELAALVAEALQSPVEIQAYNLQELQVRRFAERLREILRLSLKTVKYEAMLGPSIEFIATCGLMAALYLGVRSGIDFATFSSLALALYLSYEPVKKLSGLHAALKSRQASLERLEEILTASDTLPNPVQPRPLPPTHAPLEFRNVSFRYPNRHDPEALPALCQINVRIEPGETVALVGPSGAGKSTFALLIPRFFDPTEGQVTYGGMDLRDLDKHAWRKRIALVPQSPALFNATIAENIRLGRPDADDAAVREAARRAGAAEFIESLPQGYDTQVGEHGMALSGGQRQRIALARAFLKNAPILILDEATSALDSESEARVQEALRELIRGRTTILIAHRFSSIHLARRVLVFEEGRITGDGPPDQLAQSHPVYRRLWELQRLG
ncbi:MAG: ABC transporter ATP-binding protein [Verrucomicrobiota bacterium]|nr:ABC transporter ATP-binding protein/permease [Limisphaera sp.]MDW8381448.1 ABC transporter ATP-binding protein [Verrucomicrobiota bacterium]